jgi:AcrR family transcriptional regulator
LSEPLLNNKEEGNVSRPVLIQRKAILDAAQKLFMRQGLKATTAQVSKAAGVSEGSIFKHFKSKNDLFLAALQIESVEMPWHKLLMNSAGTGDIRKMLELAGRQLLDRLQIVIPHMVMLRSSGMLLKGACSHGDVPPPVYHGRVLAKYLRAETKLGRLSVQTPESHAHAFIGALSHYVFCDAFLGYKPAPAQDYISAVVDMILIASSPSVRRTAKVRQARTTRR